jgi:hypothetical protein
MSIGYANEAIGVIAAGIGDILNQKKIQLAPWQYYLLNKVSP